MSDSAATKRSVEEVSAPEVPEDAKKSKADDVEETGNAEAGPSTGEEPDEEVVDEDELAFLDTANIISGPRTRGKKIDFRKASEEAGPEEDDEDDDEDADVTANTTIPKTDDGSSDEEEEEEAATEEVVKDDEAPAKKDE